MNTEFHRSCGPAFLILTVFLILEGCQSAKLLPGDTRTPASKNCTVCLENVSAQEIASESHFEDENLVMSIRSEGGEKVLSVRSKRENFRALDDARECTLEVLKQDTPLFHWTKSPDHFREQGEKSAQDILKTGAHYLSRDPVDSSEFGTRLLISRPNENFYLIQPHHCRPGSSGGERRFEEMWKGSTPEAQKWLAQQKVVGSYSDDVKEKNWLSVIDSRPTRLQEATPEFLYSNKVLGKLSNPPSLYLLYMLDRRYPIPNNVWLTEKVPVVHKCLNGAPLSPEEKAELGKEFHKLLFKAYNDPQMTSGAEEKTLKDKLHEHLFKDDRWTNSSFREFFRTFDQDSSPLAQAIKRIFTKEIDDYRSEVNRWEIETPQNSFEEDALLKYKNKYFTPSTFTHEDQVRFLENYRKNGNLGMP